VHGLEVQPPHGSLTLTFHNPPDYEESKEEKPKKNFGLENLLFRKLTSHSKSESASTVMSPKQKIFQSIVFQTYEELKKWLRSSAIDRKLETAVISSPSSSMSLLECAMLFRDLETVEFLVEMCPTLPTLQHLQDLLFITACRTTDIYIVKALLQSGLDLFAVGTDCGTLFHWLFMLGDNLRYLFPILQTVVAGRHEVLDTQYAAMKCIVLQWPLRLTRTPLVFAVSAGSIAGIEMLLGLGAKPTAPIQRLSGAEERTANWTPIHLAIKYHSISMLSSLVGSKGSVSDSLNAKSCIPTTGKHLKSQIASTFNSLMNTPGFRDTWQSAIGCSLSFSTPVERIAMHGKHHEVQLAELTELLPMPCLEMRSKKGSVALMQAIDFHDVSVVAALLTAHPKLARTPFIDPLGSSFVYPIHFASQIASHRDADDALDIVKILLRLDSKQSMLRDSRGRTPLHYLVLGSSDRVTKWLIESGGSIDATTNENDTRQTPLHVIRMPSSMILLLESGANINQQDLEGCTLGHIAALAGREHLIRAFIDREASLDVRDRLGRTMLHCAIIKRSPSILIMLLKAGLDIHAKTREGNTPLHLAVQSFRSDIVRI
jgi:ankyrin repeat protein